MSTHRIICGDCIKQLTHLEGNSIDSCVTDPPYGLKFMGKDWDKFNALSFQQFTYQWGVELYRVLKPGAHILVFGSTRTYHRMACGIEDAGFEVRDMIEWIYGEGFPKSLDIPKAIDKINGYHRGKAGVVLSDNNAMLNPNYERTAKGEPISEEAIQWDGWGTALKPAHEPIVLARKPISENNITSNVLKHGTGGINIDGCRVDVFEEKDKMCRGGTDSDNRGGFITTPKIQYTCNQLGRFPANLILECCCEEDKLVEGKLQNVIHTNPNCVCKMLDAQSGILKSTDKKPHINKSNFSWKNSSKINTSVFKGDGEGGASRFFYQAKASQKERWFYCTFCKQFDQIKNKDKHIHNAPSETRYKHLVFHPTQKPIQLIQYLIRLITPIQGTTIDPFLGSGTALIAAEREKVNCIGIDSNQAYCNIAHQRLKEELKQTNLLEEKSSITIT